jgi:osmoprotectant transport system permease protein
MSEILRLTLEHIVLVGIAVAGAILVGVPAGLLAVRRPGLRRWVTTGAGLAQTIPSLALFGFLIPIPVIGGIGRRTAIIALLVYAFLPVVRNTVTGVLAVDVAVRESAVAMGMTPRQVLFQVEVPLAARTILAGIRIATVTTIGTATIAAAIGAGGLGVLIFQGISLVDTQQILAGAVPAAVLAIATDEVLGWIESRLP